MFNENLRKLRKDRGYTQAELAKKLDLEASSISKYETTGVVPPYDVLIKIAKLFNVSLDELFDIERKKIVPSDEGTITIAEHELLRDFRLLDDSQKMFVLQAVQAEAQRITGNKNQ